MQVTDGQRQQANELAEKYGHKELWVNDSGEFFTTANHAAISVGNDRGRWAKVDPPFPPAEAGGNSSRAIQGVRAKKKGH